MLRMIQYALIGTARLGLRSGLCFLVILFNLSTMAQLRVATYRYADNDRVNNIMPGAQVIASALNKELTVASYPSVHALMVAIREGLVDIAFINTAGYLALAADSAFKFMEPIATWHTVSNQNNPYRSVLIAPMNGSISNMGEIKYLAPDLDVLFVNPESTSGNLVPRLALSRFGINEPEVQFKTVTYVGNHLEAAEKIGLGKADLGAVGHGSYQEYIDDPSNPPIRLLYESPPIPLGPVLVSNQLSTKQRRRILNELKRLHRKHPRAFDAIKSGWSEAEHAISYIPVPHYYEQQLRQQITQSTTGN